MYSGHIIRRKGVQAMDAFSSIFSGIEASFRQQIFFRSPCSSMSSSAQLAILHYKKSKSKCRSKGSFEQTVVPCVITHVNISSGGKSIGRRLTSGALNGGINVVNRRCFWSDMARIRTMYFRLSCCLQYSCNLAHALPLFDGSSVADARHQVSKTSSDLKGLGERTIKFLSGSCYLPHPDKNETGGEDAHFICVEEQVIGVADGVGGWAELGINSGQYSRELMSNSVAAILDEPKGSIDPSRVLEKAHSCTKSKGSSTACIIALNEKGIHAVNLGDSGFIVVRDGCTTFKSPIQQHDFNFTYQLQSDNSSDLPSSAQVFRFPVIVGDVIVAGTDGLFDNLYNNEITAVVVHAIRAGLGPQVTAQKIAALARQRALDDNRQTPFSSAAQDAGYRYYGGKLDDITVVVSYITASTV